MNLLLLDGYNLLFRAFVTLPDSITSEDGRQINGLYGMLSTITALMRELEPSSIITAFDVPDVPTFRHKLYPLYQAQRGPMGGDKARVFRDQVELATSVLPQLGIPVLQSPGYEADDVLATIATAGVERGMRSCIVSSDRDLLQLVAPGIEVVLPSKPYERFRDEDAVCARMGVAPSLVPMVKALAGDPSDNLPGVKGIGIKTAVELTTQYRTLDGLFSCVNDLPARAGRALKVGREDAYLFQRIVTLVKELPLDLDLEDLPKPCFSEKERPHELLQKALVRPEGFEPPAFRSAT